MYKHILVTLENSASDRVIIDHIKQLAKLVSSSITLLHVATSVPAQINGPDATGEEINEDRAYLAQVQAEFIQAGLATQTHLAFGDPPTEIVKWVAQSNCDLVAMSTHGHKFIADLLLGETVSKVRHNVTVPVLLLRAK